MLSSSDKVTVLCNSAVLACLGDVFRPPAFGSGLGLLTALGVTAGLSKLARGVKADRQRAFRHARIRLVFRTVRA